MTHDAIDDKVVGCSTHTGGRDVSGAGSFGAGGGADVLGVGAGAGADVLGAGAEGLGAGTTGFVVRVTFNIKYLFEKLTDC